MAKSNKRPPNYISKKRQRKIDHIQECMGKEGYTKSKLREKAMFMKMPPQDIQRAFDGMIY